MEDSQLDPSDPISQAWALTLFSSIRDGGVWAIPRSGMIFTKRGQTLQLTAVMPWTHALDGHITEDQLLAQQMGEYAGVSACFALAGIEVMDETGLM